MKPEMARPTKVAFEIAVNEYVRLRAIRKGIPLYSAVNELLKKAIAAEMRREKRHRVESTATKELPPAATGGE